MIVLSPPTQWFAKGYDAAKAGQPKEPPADCPKMYVRHWMLGYEAFYLPPK